jgi:acetyl-CoA carboxylase biotin carboxyl carrier protein
MEFNEVLKLINTVSNSNLESFLLEEDSFKIKLKNKVQGEILQVQSSPQNTIDEENYNTIDSPLVGVFYSYNSENKEPFVSVGDSVKEGQVIGIIEAMKLMNEVVSHINGVVEEILVKDESTVEYGQPLIKIRPE